MRRLIAGSHRKGEKVTTYTIEDASFVVSEMNFAQTILLHVGINNFSSLSKLDLIRVLKS
jgi:hypothetical protein